MRQRAEEVYRKKGGQNKRWKHYTCIYLVRSVSIRERGKGRGEDEQ